MGMIMDTPLNDTSPSDNTIPAAQRALSTLADHPEDAAALETLAVSNVLVPVPTGTDDDEPDDRLGLLTLPVIEDPAHEPRVPVFTSELRMARTLPRIAGYRRVPMALLAAYWPADDLGMVIDVGDPDALTLTAERVRHLVARP